MREVPMSAQPSQAQPSDKPEDIAQLLGISVRTVQRLAESGEIPSYRVGTQLRFDRAEVLAATRTPASA
jgi:excisionase family DNA binding protein